MSAKTPRWAFLGLAELPAYGAKAMNALWHASEMFVTRGARRILAAIP